MDKKKFNAIRYEIKLRIIDLVSKGENENNALNIARKEANDKYGKGWREDWKVNDSSSTKTKLPTIYDEHTNGEHWMD